MRKPAHISRSRSGLNFYPPAELKAAMQGRRYVVDMTDLPDGSRAMRFRESQQGRNRLTTISRPDGSEQLRLFLQSGLPPAVEELHPFGPTAVVWSHGEEAGEVLVTLPPPENLASPRMARSRRGTVRRQPEAPAPSPTARLRSLLDQLNSLLASGDLADFRFSYQDSGGTPEEIDLARLQASRTETIG